MVSVAGGSCTGNGGRLAEGGGAPGPWVAATVVVQHSSGSAAASRSTQVVVAIVLAGLGGGQHYRTRPCRGVASCTPRGYVRSYPLSQEGAAAVSCSGHALGASW